MSRGHAGSLCSSGCEMSSRELAAAPVALPRAPRERASARPAQACRNHRQSRAVYGSPGAPAPLEGPAGQCPGSLGRCPHEQAARVSRSATLLRAELRWALATFTPPSFCPMAQGSHPPTFQGCRDGGRTSGSSLRGKLQEEGGDAALLAQATRRRGPGVPRHVAERHRTLTRSL